MRRARARGRRGARGVGDPHSMLRRRQGRAGRHIFGGDSHCEKNSPRQTLAIELRDARVAWRRGPSPWCRASRVSRAGHGPGQRGQVQELKHTVPGPPARGIAIGELWVSGLLPADTYQCNPSLSLCVAPVSARSTETSDMQMDCTAHWERDTTQLQGQPRQGRQRQLCS